MKKIGILIFIAAILIGVVFANLFSFGRMSGKLINFSIGSRIQGSGVTGSEVRNVIGFDGVDVGGVFHVEIIAGEVFYVEVQADDNLLQYIKTEVDGNILRIETTEGVKSRNPMRIRISAPDINGIHASGASKVSLAGVKNSSLDIDTSGASKVKVDGETADVTVEVSGASSIDAESLKARSATVDASGASHINLFATDRVRADASGASKIVYSGNPTNVEKNTSGASRVYQK